MADNKNSLSDDELWAKCQQEGPISAQDLNLTNSVNSSGTEMLTEGTLYTQFELNSKDSHK